MRLNSLAGTMIGSLAISRGNGFVVGGGSHATLAPLSPPVWERMPADSRSGCQRGVGGRQSLRVLVRKQLVQTAADATGGVMAERAADDEVAFQPRVGAAVAVAVAIPVAVA